MTDLPAPDVRAVVVKSPYGDLNVLLRRQDNPDQWEAQDDMRILTSTDDLLELDVVEWLVERPRDQPTAG